MEVSTEKDISKFIALDFGYEDPLVIDVETIWKPPRCGTCKVFGHIGGKCPNARVVIGKGQVTQKDVWIEVPKRKERIVVEEPITENLRPSENKGKGAASSSSNGFEGPRGAEDLVDLKSKD